MLTFLSFVLLLIHGLWNTVLEGNTTVSSSYWNSRVHSNIRNLPFSSNLCLHVADIYRTYLLWY